MSRIATKLTAKTLSFATIFTCILALPTTGYSAKPIADGFESYSLNKKIWWPSGKKPKIVNEQQKSGNYSAAFELNRYDSKGRRFRTELQLKKSNLRYEREYWLSVNYFVPRNWQFDKNTGPIVLQLMGVPDKSTSEAWRNPVMALSFVGDRWRMEGRWDHNAKTRVKAGRGWDYSGAYSKKLQKVRTNSWENFVFRLKMSHAKSKSGQITVWQNGKKVFDRKGPNAFNDKIAPFIKMGIYRASWKFKNAKNAGKATKHRLYMDEIAFGENLCGRKNEPKWCP